MCSVLNSLLDYSHYEPKHFSLMASSRSKLIRDVLPFSSRFPPIRCPRCQATIFLGIASLELSSSPYLELESQLVLWLSSLVLEAVQLLVDSIIRFRQNR